MSIALEMIEAAMKMQRAVDSMRDYMTPNEHRRLQAVVLDTSPLMRNVKCVTCGEVGIIHAHYHPVPVPDVYEIYVPPDTERPEPRLVLRPEMDEVFECEM